MAPYYVIGAVLFAAAAIPPWNLERSKRVRLAIALAFVPALLAGLRGEECCRDYVVYRDYFQEAPERVTLGAFFHEWKDSLANVDVGYVFGNSIAKAVGISFEEWILIAAFVSVFLTVSAYVRTSEHPLLALALYYAHPFFYREMIQVRAGVACAIALWVYIEVARGSHARAALLGAFACAIHLSAGIMVLPITLFSLGWSPRIRAALVVLASAYAASFVITPEITIFGTIERVAVYVDSAYSGEVGVFRNPTTLKQIAVLLGGMWIQQRHGFGAEERLIRLLITSYFVATVWLVLFNKFEIVGARGASFVSFVEPLLVSRLVWRAYEVRPKWGAPVNGAAAAVCAGLLLLNLEVKNVVDHYTTWVAR